MSRSDINVQADGEKAEDDEKDNKPKSCWSFLMCCWTSKTPATAPKPNPTNQYDDQSKKGNNNADTSRKAPIPLQPQTSTNVQTDNKDKSGNNGNGNGVANSDSAAAALVTQVQQNAQPIAPVPTPYQPMRPPPAKCLLPPLPDADKYKKTLVLDLDETLVHSSFKPIPNADFVISIELENVIHRVFVLKRPGVDAFLRAVGQKFEVVVFTASLAKYADPLLDILDRNKVVKTRLFREACVHHYGNYVKDLSHLGRRLEDTIIIDNSPFSYMFQPDNAIPITSWFNDKNDRQLYDLLPFLDTIVNVDDVCTVLHRRKAQQLAAGTTMG